MCPFLMSSFLMWPNLVLLLALLNILISAEVSLFSYFFFTAGPTLCTRKEDLNCIIILEGARTGLCVDVTLEAFE